MIKALFRKQFAELISQFTRRSGLRGRRTGGASLGVFLLLFAVVFAALGASFFVFFKEILAVFDEGNYEIYYLIVGLIATAVGLLGGVFNAYSSIYEAKDNEMLLSLPIPPARILFVRIAALSVMTLLYEAAVLLPAFVAFCAYARVSAAGKASAFFFVIPLTLLVVALTVGIAFVVAAIARRVKNKKAITLVASLLMVGLFYFLYFRAQNAAMALVELGSVPAGLRYGLFFYYQMGRASTGAAEGMAITCLTAILAFALAYFLLSKYFLRFVMQKRSAAAKGKVGVVKAGSRRLALFKREWKLFTSSPNYILNCSFGVVLSLALGVVAITQAGRLQEVRDMILPYLPHFGGSGLGAVVVMLTCVANDVTAPSISMEGNRLWVVRSLPVPTEEIFCAKIGLHLTVSLPFALFATVATSVIFGAGDVAGAILAPFAVIAFNLFTATFGLCMNVLRPVLDWRDEAMAVKTGFSVFVSIFGVMLFATVLTGLYFAFALIFPDWVYLTILIVVLTAAAYGMLRWLRTGGVRRFERLG
ncbi:MAG: hypothetical protein IJT69_02020 [Clostridia bacterium]|nr:hypothetical protein [Clostridia bacterium]